MIIGSHVSFGSEQILGSLKEALNYGANTFMFYTGAPQNTLRNDIDNKLSLEAKKLMTLNNIQIENIICHAPYIINLANNAKPIPSSKNLLSNNSIINLCNTFSSNLS